MTGMHVSDEHRAIVRRWCAERVPASQRDTVQISYSERAGRITLSCRRAPVFPELATEWSTAPIAQLRYDAADQRWVLLWPDSGGRWHRYPRRVEGRLARAAARHRRRGPDRHLLGMTVVRTP